MKTMAYVANSKRGGITAFELRRDDGRLIEQDHALERLGVSPLASSPDRRFLYACIRTEPVSLAAFAIDPLTGDLYLLNTVPVRDNITYLRVDAGGRFFLGVSYSGDSVGVWALGRGGMVQPEPVLLRRLSRNPHCITVDASNRFAYVPMLGNDTVGVYNFNANTGMLTPGTPACVATGMESGPRHMILSPDNRFAYLLTELSGQVISFAVNAENGTLTQIQVVSILPEDHSLPLGRYEPPLNSGGGSKSRTPVMWASDIHMTPDSRFLYVSERTGGTLSCFAVDPVSGRLRPRRVSDTEAQPRGFAIDPLGQFLLAAGERSNHVASYALERETGGLAAIDRYEVGDSPSWVEMVSL